MKIAYTISGIYNSGGMENILIQKANYLSVFFGHEITIITTDQNNRDTFFELSPQIKNIDLHINYYKWIKNPLWHIIKKVLSIKHYYRLRHHLTTNNYDIVISMMDFDMPFLYKINDNSKKILESHFSKYRKSINANNIIMRRIQKIRADLWDKTTKKYDKFIVLTQEDKKNWKYRDNICVIPNFINDSIKHKANLHNKRVISIGRFTKQKGFDLLIQSWEKVSKKYPDWTLFIIGGGDKSIIRNQINRLNLCDSVVLIDATKNIEREYLDSSLYVMSSRYEGLPLVLLEAMSYGLPIVSYACPCGPKDIVRSEFGTLVECYDSNAFALAMMDWMDSYEKRIIASQKAIENSHFYQISNIMNIWNNLFMNI